MPADPLNGIYEKLGELSADVRTVKHNQNNDSQKLDAVAKLVVAVEELSRDRDDHAQRLSKLERGSGQFTGASKFGAWLLQTLISIATAIGAVFAIRSTIR